MANQEYTGVYYQGWDNIVAELVSILEQVKEIAHVYPYLRFLRSNAESREFKEAFCEINPNSPKGQALVNVAMINQAGFPTIEPKRDCPTSFKRTNEIEIYLFQSFPDFDKWNKTINSLSSLLNSCDRTLNQSCLTFFIPPGTEHQRAEFGGVDCHHVILRLKIEEAGEYPEDGWV